MSTTASPEPEPDSPTLALAPDGPLWGAWSLAGTLIVAHAASAFVYAQTARATRVEALFLARSVRFRVTAGGQYGPLVADGEWWRLVRSVGLHADALHLAVNTIAIVVLGRLLEPWVGPVRLLWWFGLAGVGGSITSQLAGLTQSDGASGGAFGLLGAAIVIGVRYRDRLDAEDRTIVTRWLPGFLVANVIVSLILPFVDAVGHLGGLGVGVALGLFAKPARPRAAITALEVIGIAILLAIALFKPTL